METWETMTPEQLFLLFFTLTSGRNNAHIKETDVPNLPVPPVPTLPPNSVPGWGV